MRKLVRLCEVTEANRAEVLALSVSPEQERFVSSVADSLREAECIPEGHPWYRALYVEDEAVGFVMISWNVEPDPPAIIGPWFLWKLLIDTRHQHNGFGRQTVEQVIEIVRQQGGNQLYTSHVEGEGSPRPFYEALGFRPTGEHDDEGEPILALDL